MSDDQDRCEWVNVSSMVPAYLGSPTPKAIKLLCVWGGGKKFGKIFRFWGPVPLPLHQWHIFGMISCSTGVMCLYTGTVASHHTSGGVYHHLQSSNDLRSSSGSVQDGVAVVNLVRNKHGGQCPQQLILFKLVTTSCLFYCQHCCMKHMQWYLFL